MYQIKAKFIYIQHGHQEDTITVLTLNQII